MSRLHYTRTFYPYSRNVCIFIHTLNVSLFFLLQVLVFFFFFFQAEDGIRDGGRDWSSDVCSSDLISTGTARAARTSGARRPASSRTPLSSYAIRREWCLRARTTISSSNSRTASMCGTRRDRKSVV